MNIKALKFWNRLRLKDDTTWLKRMEHACGEIIGTAILLFIGCMTCCICRKQRSVVEYSLGFGFAVLMAVQSVLHISGSHINPMISIAATILGYLPLIETPMYMTGQVIGAFLGYGLLKGVLPYNLTADGRLCSPDLQPDVSELQGVVIEFLISFVLTTVFCGVTDIRNVIRPETISLRFGFTICGLAIAAGPFTGAHMNPARTLGPAVINGYWKNHWIYWVGPFLAGFVAPVVYTILFTSEEELSKDKIEETE